MIFISAETSAKKFEQAEKMILDQKTVEALDTQLSTSDLSINCLKLEDSFSMFLWLGIIVCGVLFIGSGKHILNKNNPQDEKTLQMFQSFCVCFILTFTFIYLNYSRSFFIKQNLIFGRSIHEGGTKKETLDLVSPKYYRFPLILAIVVIAGVNMLAGRTTFLLPDFSNIGGKAQKDNFETNLAAFNKIMLGFLLILPVIIFLLTVFFEDSLYNKVLKLLKDACDAGIITLPEVKVETPPVVEAVTTIEATTAENNQPPTTTESLPPAEGTVNQTVEQNQAVTAPANPPIEANPNVVQQTPATETTATLQQQTQAQNQTVRVPANPPNQQVVANQNLQPQPQPVTQQLQQQIPQNQVQPLSNQQIPNSAVIAASAAPILAQNPNPYPENPNQYQSNQNQYYQQRGPLRDNPYDYQERRRPRPRSRSVNHEVPRGRVRSMNSKRPRSRSSDYERQKSKSHVYQKKAKRQEAEDSDEDEPEEEEEEEEEEDDSDEDENDEDDEGYEEDDSNDEEDDS